MSDYNDHHALREQLLAALAPLTDDNVEKIADLLVTIHRFLDTAFVVDGEPPEPRAWLAEQRAEALPHISEHKRADTAPRRVGRCSARCMR